jgi:DNA-binding FrmR family transcriptional regulator
MNTEHPSHARDLPRLKRIEGQVRGVQKMVEEGRYCVDILTQLSSIVGAVRAVEENVLRRHLDSCVRESLSGPGRHGRDGRDEKVTEILDLLAKFRRHSS